MKKLLSIIFILSVQVISIQAKNIEKFEWDSVTDSDWAVTEDTALGYKDAVILFEKIEMDDRDMYNEKCYYTIYRRYRILSTKGREYGDIAIPVFDVNQKIEDVQARTIRSDGDTLYVTNDQIVEKEVFKNKKLKIKQQSFSMPGLSDDCIIEYYIKYRLHDHLNFWNIQKDIPLLYGELNWYLFYGKGMSKELFKVVGSVMAPNYLSLCMDPQNDIEEERLPNLKETNQIIFRVKNITAFKEEPYSLPENSLTGQLHYYYAKIGAASAFWGEYSSIFVKWLDEYIDKSKHIKKIVKQFNELPTDKDKINAAYAWVSDSLTNLTFIETDKEVKSNKYETADKAIKSGYAKSLYIDYIFCDMLREMNIDAKVCRVVDRDEDIFVPEAKYWQFDRMIVGVEDAQNSKWTFYSPGSMFLKPGQVSWYNEGVSALVGGAFSNLYASVPFSLSSDNSLKRIVNVSINDDFDVFGHVEEKITGHQARSVRFDLVEIDESEFTQEIETYITNEYDNDEIDSVEVEFAGTYKEPLGLNYQLQFANVENDLVGDRILLKPLTYMKKISNPFTAETRTNVIVFDYAYEIMETVQLELPETMKIEAVPENFEFNNQAGSCIVNFSQVGENLVIQRLFKLKTPYLFAENYPIIQNLFQNSLSTSDLTVSLLYTE